MQFCKKKMLSIVLTLAAVLTLSLSLAGCGSSEETSGKTVITMLQYRNSRRNSMRPMMTST